MAAPKQYRVSIEGRHCQVCGALMPFQAWKKPNEYLRQLTCGRQCAARMRIRPIDQMLEAAIPSGRPDTCWEWPHYRDRKGYGRAKLVKGEVLIHRLSYLVYVGEIPAGYHVMHKCDNPPCFNPAHLAVGTNYENHLDKMRKNRQRGAVGELNCKAKLTADEALEIRQSTLSIDKLAAIYGVDRANIYAIRRRLIWKHVA